MKILLKRHWPLLGLGMLLAVVAFYLLKSGKGGGETAIKEIIMGEGLMLKDIHYAQDNPEKGILWALDAQEMKSSGDKSLISFKGFRLKVQPKDGPPTELTGAKGDYSRDSGEINLWGNLEGVSGNGFKVTADHLLIHEKSGKITSDKPVKMMGPGFTVEGQGLFFDLKNETLKILSSVTATIEKEAIAK